MFAERPSTTRSGTEITKAQVRVPFFGPAERDRFTRATNFSKNFGPQLRNWEIVRFLAKFAEHYHFKPLIYGCELFQASNYIQDIHCSNFVGIGNASTFSVFAFHFQIVSTSAETCESCLTGSGAIWFSAALKNPSSTVCRS